MEKCNPKGRDCIEEKSSFTFNCQTSCEGIYADAVLWPDFDWSFEDMIEPLTYEYNDFKRNNVQYFRFNSTAVSTVFGNLTKSTRKPKSYELPGNEMPQSTLQLVEIRFDTATFDDIERDKKIKTEAQLSLIGGTMGLLTGFSIISGIEIVFFLFR